MKKYVHCILLSKICKIILCFFILCLFCRNGFAEKTYPERKKIFENAISEIARDYIGIPFTFGGNPEEDGTADNSNLLCSIYEKAAKRAGLRFAGYMPMSILMRHAIPVRPDNLQNGDLMVLRNGHAAMVYNVEKPDYFDLIYASGKKREVISFSSRNVVFEVFWLQHLDGYYRLREYLFTLAGP